MPEFEVTQLVATQGLLSDNLGQDLRRSIAQMPEMSEQNKSISVLGDFLRRSRAGDSQAMEAIYEQFKRPVFNLALRYASDRAGAEDLLQDIFIKIFTHLSDVDQEKTFAAWVYRIALNSCYSYLRSKRSRQNLTVPLSDVEGRMDEAVYDSHEEKLGQPLEEAVQSLPHKLRSVFVLHDVQGFKHEEIAAMLRCSVGTSKSQLFKARMKIRNFLTEKKVL